MIKVRINECKKQISSFASFFNSVVRKEISPKVIIILFVIVAAVFIETLRRDLNLASALVAFGTLILACFTFLSILNSRDRETRDRKERLLNEIIEWALDISNFLRGWNVAQLAYMSGEEGKKFAQLQNWLTSSNDLTSRSISMSKIAEVFGASLNKTVKNVVDNLYEHNRLLNEWCDDKVNLETAIKQKSVFGQSVNKLIEEAAKIKTRGIR